MPTVQEILKQSGMTDEQVAAIDAKAVQAFNGVLTAAERERQQAATDAERAAVERRSNRQFYDESIAPALNTWGNEKAAKDAELAFYRSQLESARDSGFVPVEAPSQQRDSQGRYVAGTPGATPGSPTFQGIDQLRNEVGGALGTLADLQWRHQKLFGEPMPISPTQLVHEAEGQRLDPVAYAERRFGFAAKEKELAERAEQAKIDAATQAAVAANDRKWAEKIGSNPDVRIGQSSKYADVQRAIKAGERPDPLMLNEGQRKMATRQAIRTEVAENISNTA